MQDDDKAEETPTPGEDAAPDTSAEGAGEETPGSEMRADAVLEETPEAGAPEPEPTSDGDARVEAGEPASDEIASGEPGQPIAAAVEDTPAESEEAAPAEGSAVTGAAADAGEGLAEPDVLPDELPTTSSAELRAIVEALVFVAPQPLTLREMGRVLPGIERGAIKQALAELRDDYGREGRGLQLVEVAAGWQITTRPEYNDRVRELIDPRAPTRLSIQALETLAVIAYKQPVTLPEVIELRGVRSGGVVKTLLDKRLIKIVGRKEVVGRPILYGTTKEFLLHFGMKDLSELPKIEEFAEVLGEEVDVIGLKRAIEAPRPAEVPLSEEPPVPAEAEAAPEPTENTQES